jgi:hypothetical protein
VHTLAIFFRSQFPFFHQASTSERPKQKKKGTREEGFTESKKPKKSFKDYTWTPLNALIFKVLMEVKKDPTYQKPRPLTTKPPPRLTDRYCAFHDSYGYYTEGCISLRLLIEKFI